MSARAAALLVLGLLLPSAPGHADPARPARDESAAGWFRAGAARAHRQGAGHQPTRNVILFIGDGMSLTTVTAARILEGQRRGEPGEENRLSFEEFPYTALSRTYNVDSQTPDSAGTMSAMVTGVKTRMGVISTPPEVPHGDCAAAGARRVLSLMELAEQAGLATGLVTTTRITHATPAATYGHSPDRTWEGDADLPVDAVAAGCRDLARQLVEFPDGDGLDVVFGGGREKFLPQESSDPEYPQLRGSRRDHRNLIQAWRKRHPGARFVWNRQQFAALDPRRPTPVLGLFEPDHLHFEHDRGKDAAGEPSLAEMVGMAIQTLSTRKQGYVLVVEGGRIDHAHHYGNAFRALDETISFSDAIRVARQATSEDDTLILVTADHSHTLTLVGYPVRGNPILGKVAGASGEDDKPGLAHDLLGRPFTTLMYANGPGYAGASNAQPQGAKHFSHEPSEFHAVVGAPDLSQVDTEDPDYLQEALHPLLNESHGGEDVGVWASGPSADAVRGSLEQNVIFHLLTQSQPALRAQICKLAHCDAEGVAQDLPQRRQAR